PDRGTTVCPYLSTPFFRGNYSLACYPIAWLGPPLSKISNYRRQTSGTARLTQVHKSHTLPWPWNGPALQVTTHCTGKRREGRVRCVMVLCTGVELSPFNQY